jgi:hypothetical protein
MSGPDWAMLRHHVATIQALLKKRYDAPPLEQTLADLSYLQKLLDDNLFEAHQTEEIAAIGVVFGNVVQRQLVFEWVMAERGREREPALQLKTQPSLVVHPLKMVRDPIAAGEAVDLQRLYRIMKDEVARTRIL